MTPFRQELEAVYDRFSHQFFVCALAITGNRTLAEDAVHDAFCRALGKPRNPGNVKAYMFESVRNAAMDIVRKNNRIKRWTVCQMNSTHRHYREDTDERFDTVLSAIRQLKAMEREIVMAHLVGNMKFREIAEAQNQPMGTVTSHYQRAMTQLRRLLGVENG